LNSYQWGIFVVGVFILILFKLWNRYTRGAVVIAAIILVLGVLFFVVNSCAFFLGGKITRTG